jgi:Lipid A core - O-antigen ligase and related enzymes
METGKMTARWTGSWGMPLAAALLAALAVAFASSRSPFLTIAALGVVLLLVFVLTQPQTVLLILLAALPWEGMLNFPTPTFTVVKLLGSLLIISLTLNAIAQGTRLRAPPAVVAAFAFVIFAAISIIASPDPGVGIAKVQRYAFLALFFFIVVQLLYDRTRLLMAMRVLIASLGAAAVWGLILFLSGHADRASGPIKDPNDYAYLLAVMLPVCLYLIVDDRVLRWLWVACFTAMVGATFAALSRGAFVALGVTLIWAVLTRRVRLGGLLVSALVVFVMLAVGFSLWGSVINERVEKKQQIGSENAASRLDLWSGAVKMAMDRPITGVGAGRFGAESVKYVRDNPIILNDPVTHNSYLEILAESGPFCLAAFLAFIGACWLTLARTFRAAREHSHRGGVRQASALQAALLIAIVGGMFVSVQVASPFWVIGGFAIALPLVLGRTGLSAYTAASGSTSSRRIGAAAQ